MIGWILLAILGVLILLLAVPFHGIVIWRLKSPPTVRLKWLFLQYTVFPRPERPEVQKKPARAKTKKPPRPKKPKAEKTPEGFSKQLGVILDLIASLKGIAGFILRRFRLYHIRLDMVVAKDDAAQTAIAYGRVNAAVYTAYAVAKGTFRHMREPVISIRPDFTAQEGKAELEVRGKLSPLHVLLGGGKGVGIFLARLIRRKAEANEENKDVVNEK